MKVQSFLRKKRISRQRISGNPFSQRYRDQQDGWSLTPALHRI